TDPDSTPENPKVTRTATKAILPVAIEVVVGTALLGWAMLSLPRNLLPQLSEHKEDMLRFLAEVYGTMADSPAVGQTFSWIVGIVFGLLLLSAVNTAMVALIGVVYMMAQDGELPRRLTRSNPHGVPSTPLVAAVAVRGVTPALSFALEEAQLRKATLCVLYVKEIAVYFTGRPTEARRARWQDDPEANAIMSLTMRLGAERDIAVQPVYAVSEDAA